MALRYVMLAFMKIVALALVAVGLGACSAHTQISLLGVTEVRPGTLEVVTPCAEDITVEVEEASDEVHIAGVTGVPIDGDCASAVTVELKAPLDERVVVVDGEHWVELLHGCSWGDLGPPVLYERCPSR
jgi:hypothetical protein